MREADMDANDTANFNFTEQMYLLMALTQTITDRWRNRRFSMTPEFQGTHLWDRLGWAKQNLEPYRSEYCIVWEDPDNLDEPAKVTHTDPNGWLVH